MFQVDILVLQQLPKNLLNPATPRALRVHSRAAPFRAWPGPYDRNNGNNPPIIITITSNPEGREIMVDSWLATRLVIPSVDFNPAYRRFRLQQSCKGYAYHPDLAHIFRLLLWYFQSYSGVTILLMLIILSVKTSMIF